MPEVQRVLASKAQPGDVLVFDAGDIRQLREARPCDSPDQLTSMTWLDGRVSLCPSSRLFVRLHPVTQTNPTEPESESPSDAQTEGE